MSHVTWHPCVNCEDLIHTIEASQICLGIFGTSEKAASVVPNKVYQTLFAGRLVIARESPAMDETFAPHDALLLVPPADPTAILDAIDIHVSNGLPTIPQDQLSVARSVELLRTTVPRKKAPGGVGVRDGIIALGLGLFLRAGAALLNRAISVLGDVIAFVFGLAPRYAFQGHQSQHS